VKHTEEGSEDAILNIKGRLLVFCVAAGLPIGSVRAFDQARWSHACQRALKSVEACDLTDTYIEFACDRTARKSGSAGEAREDIERTIRPICETADSERPGRNEDRNRANQQSKSDEDTVYVGPAPCVITTACSELCGLDDDCYELKSLRKFRDRYMIADPAKAKMVRGYYQRSVEILDKLSQREDRMSVLAQAYAFYILPAALLASAGLDRMCYARYCRGIRFLQAAAVGLR
jgi:hypothetical protein